MCMVKNGDYGYNNWIDSVCVGVTLTFYFVWSCLGIFSMHHTYFLLTCFVLF